MAGYSQTPLLAKLGITIGGELAVLDAPAGLVASWNVPPEIPTRTRVPSGAPTPRFAVMVAFVLDSATLAREMARWSGWILPDGGLWIAWPKLAARKALKLDSDMTEGAVRDVALPLGLVDNKVCAIDETWSGLRCVWRRELRASLKVPAAKPSRSRRGPASAPSEASTRRRKQ